MLMLTPNPLNNGIFPGRSISLSHVSSTGHMLIVWQKKKVAFIHNIYTVFILQTKSLEK